MDGPDERILKCFDRALDTLGQSVKRVTYFYLAKEEGLVPKDLIRKPGRFLDGLHNFFGTGADIIENWIIRELRKEAYLPIRESGNLLEAIDNAKRKLAGKAFC